MTAKTRDGRQLHFERHGDGSPIVVFEAGMGASHLFFSKANERQVRLVPKIMPTLARTGVLRLFVKRLATRLPEPWATGLRTEDGTVAALHEQLAELRPSSADLRRLRDEPLALPDVPVSVISGARSGILERGRRTELIAAHRAHAATLRQGRHVLAPASSHYVPFTDPDIITTEIIRILDSV